MTKNKLRITIAIIASLAIVAAMASCGKVEAPNDGGGSQNSDSSSQTSAPTDAAEPISSLPPVTENVDETTQTQPDVTESPVTEPVLPEVTNPPETTVADTDISEPTPDDNTDGAQQIASYGEAIVSIAQAQLGIPYQSGGDSPEKGFESSGFTYYCVNQAGMKFPRSIKSQLEAYSHVSYSELAAGDIVYFSAEPNEKASFCGVYVGGGLIIYSPVPDEFVKTANITTNYWTSRFVTGLRIE